MLVLHLFRATLQCLGHTHPARRQNVVEREGSRQRTDRTHRNPTHERHEALVHRIVVLSPARRTSAYRSLGHDRLIRRVHASLGNTASSTPSTEASKMSSGTRGPLHR